MSHPTYPLPARQADALLALADVMEVHGVTIGACGCCNSPWVTVDGVDFDEEIKAQGRGSNITPESIRAFVADHC